MAILLTKRQQGHAPMLGSPLAWPVNPATLSQQTLSTVTIRTAVEDVDEVNNHPYIAHDGTKFWAMWSTGVGPNEDASGQRVAYSTSTDGSTWAARAFVTPAPSSNFRYIARGFWARNGEWLALAAHDESNQGYFGDSLELRAFKWNGSAWVDTYLVQDDSISNFPPEPYPGGGWIYSRRTHDEQISLSVGDIGSWSDYSIPAPTDGAEYNEPTQFFLPNGKLCALIRDNNGGKIYRAIYDQLTDPLGAARRTNFPDASSKHFILALSDGRYVLISNPGTHTNATARNPLCMSVSDDGLVFDRMVKLKDETGTPQWAGAGKGFPGPQYPNAVEYNGKLYVIYVLTKENVKLMSVDLDDIV